MVRKTEYIVSLFFIFTAFQLSWAEPRNVFEAPLDLNKKENIAWLVAIKKQKPFRAAFTQNRKLAHLEKSLTSSGEIIFQSPGKIIWSVNRPSKSTFWISKKGIAQIDPGSEKPSKKIKNRGKKIWKLFAADSLDPAQLTKVFEVFGYKNKSTWHVGLVPKKKVLAKRIVNISLKLDKNLSEIRIQFPEGDALHIAFKNHQFLTRSELSPYFKHFE